MSLLMSQTNSLQSLQRLSKLALLMVYSYVFILFVCNPRWASFTGSLSFIFSIALIQADYLHIVGQCLFGNFVERQDTFYGSMFL